MTRWKAAAIHVSISVAIGLLSAALIFGLWYPPPYSRATGAPELVMLLLGVDLALGPLLTLAVFKSGKKGLKFDLAVIALLQTCALLYGLSVVARARPAFIVGAIDRFVLVSANELDPKDLEEGKPGFRSVPWTGPRLVAVELPPIGKERDDLTFSGFAGKDVEKFPKYYVDYGAAMPKLLSKAKAFDTLRKTHPNVIPALDAWLHAHTRTPDSVLALPIMSRRGELTMLLDAKTGQPLDALTIDIW